MLIKHAFFLARRWGGGGLGGGRGAGGSKLASTNITALRLAKYPLKTPPS